MNRFNAITETFEEITVFEKPALFTCIRIDRTTIPAPLQMYEIRHADDGDPVQIAKGIAVNHFGTIITTDIIVLPADGYLDIDSDVINFGCGDCRTVLDFMDKYITKE